MGLIIILLEIIVLIWTGRLIKKSTPLPVRREFYWGIIRGMAWRLLILLGILPVIAGILMSLGTSSVQNQVETVITIIMVCAGLYLLIMLSVMWRAKSVVNALYVGSDSKTGLTNSTPTASSSPPGTRLAEAQSMLKAGHITQPEYLELKKKILADV